jgi:hypothetical protein
MSANPAHSLLQQALDAPKPSQLQNGTRAVATEAARGRGQPLFSPRSYAVFAWQHFLSLSEDDSPVCEQPCILRFSAGIN